MRVTRILIAWLIVFAPSLHTCGHGHHADKLGHIQPTFAAADQSAPNGVEDVHACPACTLSNNVYLPAPAPNGVEVATIWCVEIPAPCSSVRYRALLASLPPRAPPA